MPFDPTRVRALLFDVDGTLSDTDDLFVLTLARWLRPGSFLFRRQDPLPFARRMVMIAESPGTFVYGLPDRLGLDNHLARLSDRLTRMRPDISARQFLLIDGVHEALARLAGRFPMGIVSARGERSTLAFLDQFELRPYFQHVATAQTCRFTKPYPDPILWAAEQMGMLPQECVMIGDTSVDIRAGRAAGAQTIGVLCGFGQEVELRRMGADLIVKRTPDVVPFLLSESEAGQK